MSGGGYFDLLSIYQADAQQRAFYAARPPESCPNDGTPLEAPPGDQGRLFCPFDGYTWPDDGALPGQAGGG